VRAAAAVLAASLALAALPASAGAQTAAGASAPAEAGARASADCVPVQHSKKVVKRKKVRRGGKWVRVKRKQTKRWWTCEPTPPPPGCAVPSSNLGVTAHDVTGTRYALSRPCVSAGQVNVELRNQGEDPHNLFIRPVGAFDPVYSIPEDEPFELAPMGVQDRTLSLSAGQWYLWCSLLSHELDGMNATLTVG
jgi:hypothetical protein